MIKSDNFNGLETRKPERLKVSEFFPQLYRSAVLIRYVGHRTSMGPGWHMCEFAFIIGSCNMGNCYDTAGQLFVYGKLIASCMVYLNVHRVILCVPVVLRARA
mmetsp:Transcript_6963/g.10127  ORF Transcript_6963/g.10127 Transcript_6963/m.10127 type:complete len:103 (+) Transcript_6963:329-637(+)